MIDSKIETTIGMCVVALTRYIMELQNLDYESAYKKLLTLELYQLLTDSETRLFFETNRFLCEACKLELTKGKEALYQFINQCVIRDCLNKFGQSFTTSIYSKAPRSKDRSASIYR